MNTSRRFAQDRLAFARLIYSILIVASSTGFALDHLESVTSMAESADFIAVVFVDSVHGSPYPPQPDVPSAFAVASVERTVALNYPAPVVLNSEGSVTENVPKRIILVCNSEWLIRGPELRPGVRYLAFLSHSELGFYFCISTQRLLIVEGKVAYANPPGLLSEDGSIQTDGLRENGGYVLDELIEKINSSLKKN